MAAIWQHEWERLTVWEASGGRVLHWAVTTHVRLHYAVHNAVCIFRLAADPSFEYYLSADEKPLEGTTYLPLYEMTPAQAVHAMQQYETCSWVAVLRSDQTSKTLKDVRRLGRLGQRFVKGAKIMMKRRWWETGERTVDDVQEGIKNVEERGGDEPDGGENGEHQEAGSSNNVQVNALW
jgi:hypothetical protein